MTRTAPGVHAVESAAVSCPLPEDEALSYASASPSELAELCRRAARVRDRIWGRCLTYSPKVFLPVTNLCRNRCEYCAFRRSASEPGAWTMTPHEIEGSLERAERIGCVEALFCLGDTPESAFPSYRATLSELGQESTVAYLEWAGQRALALGLSQRSEERRVGKECCALCRSRWSPYH